MSRSRARVAFFVAAVAALVSGCALVVSGLDTDFGADDDAAATLPDASGGDATTGAADAAIDAAAPPLPPLTTFAPLPLACAPTAGGWQLDCTFGTGASVVVGQDSVVSAPVLTEGDDAQAVYVAVGRDGGTFIEGIVGDGGRTLVAVADAGDPVDLTTVFALSHEAVVMLSNLVVDGTLTPVVSVKGILGTAQDSTNDVGVEQGPAADASIAAVRLLLPTLSIAGTSATYLVNSANLPGELKAYLGASAANQVTVQPLAVTGACGSQADFGPIATGTYVQNTITWIVNTGSDGGSAACEIPANASGDVYVALPYVVDDSLAASSNALPVVASRVDGGARIDILQPPEDTSAAFPIDEPAGQIGPLHLREVHQPDGGDGLLVATASSTGNLYLALYSVTPGTPPALTLDPTFGDAGILAVPLKVPAQLGRAVFAQGAYYVSLTLMADAGLDTAVVIRIVNPGSP